MSDEGNWRVRGVRRPDGGMDIVLVLDEERWWPPAERFSDGDPDASEGIVAVVYRRDGHGETATVSYRYVGSAVQWGEVVSTAAEGYAPDVVQAAWIAYDRITEAMGEPPPFPEGLIVALDQETDCPGIAVLPEHVGDVLALSPEAMN